MVPHLVTALTGPINELEQRILESLPAIERWFRLEWMEHTPPFYTSVDVRNAGFKLAPVDTDLFPRGFNHLTPMPGTPLYRRLEAEGRLLSPAWWLDETYTYNTVPFRPARMTPGEIRECCLRTRRASPSRRIPRRAVSLPVFQASSIASLTRWKKSPGRRPRSPGTRKASLPRPPKASRRRTACALRGSRGNWPLPIKEDERP